jgi:hypothetical protein
MDNSELKVNTESVMIEETKKLAEELHSSEKTQEPVTAQKSPEVVDFLPTQEDIQENYEFALGVFGDSTFSIEEYLKNSFSAYDPNWKEEDMSDKMIADTAKIFDAIVASGKFKKVGDKYQVVPEKKIETILEQRQDADVIPPTPVEPAVEIKPEPVVPSAPEVVAQNEAGNQNQTQGPVEGPMSFEQALAAAPNPDDREKIIEANLTANRDQYATVLVEYKNKNRENKRWYKKIFDGLGFEKPLSEMPVPKIMEEVKKKLDSAETAYIAAKKQKMAEIMGSKIDDDEVKKIFPDWKPGKIATSEEYSNILNAVEKVRAVEQAEKEWNILQQKIMENTPPLEKRIGQTKENYGKEISELNFEEKERAFMKAREVEQNQIKRNRLKKAAVMMAVGAGTNVAINLTAANVFGAVPGVAKPTFHQGPTKAIVGAEIRSNGGVGNNIPAAKANLIDNTNILKQGELPSAGHAGLAPGVNVENSATQNLHTDVPLAPAAPSAIPAAIPSGPKVSEAILQPEAKVELNSAGFIKTFQELKEQLGHKYPNLETAPAGVKHFLETPSTKLAQEYGFWDVKHGTSAMGYKGESLSLDTEGHLKLEHLSGKPTEIIGTGDKSFEAIHSEKMFVPKAPAPHEVIETKISPENTVVGAEPQIDVPSYTLHGPLLGPIPEMHAPNINFPEHILKPKIFDTVIGGKTGNIAEHIDKPKTPNTLLDFQHIAKSVDGKNVSFHTQVIEMAGQKRISVEGTLVGSPVKYPNGAEGMTLSDNFQNGSKSAPVREAFWDAQDKMKFAKLDSTTEIPFESGRISVIHGTSANPNELHAYLNGKEIAKGLATEKGPQLKLLPDIHRAHWWKTETVYDRAFKYFEKFTKAKNNADLLKKLTLPKVVNK